MILLLFFGTAVTAEMEQRTWLTLKTQPIPKWKRIAGKYAGMLIMIVVFFVMVIGIGLLIPLLFGNHSIHFSYPQIVTLGDTFTIISTLHYLTRGVVLFLCAAVIAFSMIMSLSIWLKNSFRSLTVICFAALLGLIVTDMNSVLQSPLNPFQYFRFSQILSEAPQDTDWLYPTAALAWGFLFVLLAVCLPEKETELFSSADRKKPFRGGHTQKHSSAFWSIFVFEWRKDKRKGLLKQLYVLLSVMIVIGYIFISQQAQQKEETYMEGLKQRVQVTENIVIPETEKMKENAIDSEIEEGWEKALIFLNEQLTKNKAAVAAYEQGEWLPFYEYQLFENQFANKEFDTGSIGSVDKDNLGEFTIDVSIAEKQWLMERNIQPVFSGDYVLTIFHNLDEDQLKGMEWKQMKEANKKVDNSGLFSLYHYFDYQLYFVPMILFLFLLGGGFALERGKKPTLHFLKTQPASVKKLFFGKVIHAITVAILSCLSLFVIVLLIGSLFDRFGDWQYPILHYDSASLANSPAYTGNYSTGKGFHFIPLGDYLVQTIILFLFVLLFLIVWTNFLSLFFKNQFTVFTTTILIGAVGYVLSSQLLTELAHLSPFTYIPITQITNGEVSVLKNNPDIHVWTGSLVLLVSTLVLLAVGYWYVSRENKLKNNKGKSAAFGQTKVEG
ncbi:ABC transporter permease [Bacillaceae bacterium Marseille-Q3522]|nr:ABC transporter permease [Bacillaceae bacterium Marseille-Q3522]